MATFEDPESMDGVSLISEAYRQQLRQMHANKAQFGVGGAEIPQQVKQLLETYSIKTVLDFGAGKGLFTQAMRQRYPQIDTVAYDPAFEALSDKPNQVGMVYSSDVLEHVEPDRLDETLADLFERCTQVQYHHIACHPARKRLPDGRNAHLIIESPAWWKAKFQRFGWPIAFETVQSGETTKKGQTLMRVFYTIVVTCPSGQPEPARPTAGYERRQ
ncbi:MAG: class I SAM-dependent methyltransferase [Cyanobacteria bacterium J06554_6]